MDNLNKERIVELLNKTHVPGVPDWTTQEQYEMFEALQLLAFLWFRTENLKV